MRKFRGSLVELQELVATTGSSGDWLKLKNQTQYRADSGAILNFWESTGTVNFQGPSSAAKEFEAAVFQVNAGDTRARKPQPDTSGAVVGDADLQALTSAIIRNRIGPVFDDESAFIGKVARQCMSDLVEQLGLPAEAKETIGTLPQTRRFMNHPRAEGDR
jgi:hypothetical protein